MMNKLKEVFSHSETAAEEMIIDDAIKHFRNIVEATDTKEKYNEGFVDGLKEEMRKCHTELIKCSHGCHCQNRTGRKVKSMKDPIERQAAIDVVNSVDNLDAKAKGGIYFKLMGLPPAEPEIIYCKDCIHYYGEPGNPNIICFQMHEDDFCSYGERREKKE